MHLRDKIKIYAKHGGPWKHLEDELLIIGFSNKLASDYVSRISKKLSYENSRKALDVYDIWMETKDESTTGAYMLLLSI